MLKKEKLLSNITLESIIKVIDNETNPFKKVLFKKLKTCKLSEVPEGKEHIVAIDQEKVSDIEGFIPYNKSLADRIKQSSISLYRCEAEHDDDYRQIVCSSIIRSKNQEGEIIYGFTKRKIKKPCGSSELIGKLNMIGGHMNSSDPSFLSCIIREVGEEIRIPIEYCTITPIGIIKQTISGRRSVTNEHLSIVFIIDVPEKFNSQIRFIESNSETFIWIEENKIYDMKEKWQEMCDSWTTKVMTHIISNSNNKL